LSSFKHEREIFRDGGDGASTSAKELQWMRGAREEENIATLQQSFLTTTTTIGLAKSFHFVWGVGGLFRLLLPRGL
jgi:hypothetical protein